MKGFSPLKIVNPRQIRDLPSGHLPTSPPPQLSCTDLNVTGCRRYAFTCRPFCTAGTHFPLLLITRSASSLNPPVSGPLIAFTSLTFPSRSTTNCTTTVPSIPAFIAAVAPAAADHHRPHHDHRFHYPSVIRLSQLISAILLIRASVSTLLRPRSQPSPGARLSSKMMSRICASLI
jgi:hypothetical protein